VKENLIMFAVGAAWTALLIIGNAYLQARDERLIMKTQIAYIEKKFSYLEKQIGNCVTNPVWQVEKMRILDKLPK